MPMPKPTKPEDLCIGANGLTNQVGRPPKTLDIKVVKTHRMPEHADIMNQMPELAAKKRALDAEG
jgi:hypothetical protein